MHRMIFLLFAGMLCAGNAAAATNILFVVDASGSMWEKVDGKPKIVIAKQVLNETLSALPADTRLGLMTYGRRSKGNCSDIEVLSPIGADSHAAVASKVAGLTPKGETPIAGALAKAAALFTKSAADHNQIILITDGAEECGGDPCAAARQLVAAGLDLHVNVVGFSLQKKQRDAVECVAREGNGKYYDAKDAAGLTGAMKSVSSDALVPTRPDGINLLAGGSTVAVPSVEWAKPIDGKDGDFAYVHDGDEGVYAFKDEKIATVSKFAVRIAGQNIDNPKQIELLAADDLAGGKFRSLGVFNIQNLRAKSLFQEFALAPTKTRYVKIRLISFYGHDAGGGSILPQIWLGGELPNQPASQAVAPAGVNLLAGGAAVTVPSADWAKPIDGKEGDFAYVLPGQEGVYAFKDKKAAVISGFSVLVAGQNIDNPKEIELLASDGSAAGTFRSLGIFHIQNLRLRSGYQKFSFPSTAARFVKIRLVSFYGHDAGGGAILPQIRVTGRPAL